MPDAYDVLTLVACFFGTVLNSLYLASFIGSETLRNKPEMILNANLALTDLAFSLVTVCKHLWIVTVGCNYEAPVTMGLAYTSTATLASISVYNCLLIVPTDKIHISRRALFIWSGCLWLLGTFWASIGIPFGMEFVRHTDTSFCTVNYASSSGQGHIFYTVCIGAINMCYGLVFLKFLRVSRSAHSREKAGKLSGRKSKTRLRHASAPVSEDGRPSHTSQSRPSSIAETHAISPDTGVESAETSSNAVDTMSDTVQDPRANPRLFQMKMAIIRRAVIIAAGFLLCWTPFMVATMYQTFSQTFSSGQLYSIATVIAICSVVVNPVSFFLVDKNCRIALFKILGIPRALWDRKQVSVYSGQLARPSVSKKTKPAGLQQGVSVSAKIDE
ncbi:hypothetical protein BC831DRAFT_442420 [Entophlyctis helioformis]|nr:hypothetical protein BC831DRAFT_442420 [Entophlyctis helioformis]